MHLTREEDVFYESLRCSVLYLLDLCSAFNNQQGEERGNRARPEEELSKTIFRPDISCLMNGFSFGYENKSKAWQQSTHLLARKLFMNSHASFAESTDPGEKVEKSTDSPCELDW